MLLSILFCASAASAFELTGGYPKRANTTRSAPPPGLFDLASTTAGINRADCLDDSQRYQFALEGVPESADAIEVWARGTDASCASPEERKSSCFRVARWALGGTMELDNASIVQAMEKKASVDTKVDPKQLCNKTDHMVPAAVHLHVMAFSGSDVVGYSSSGESKPAEIDYVTLYDIGGPPAPTGLTLGAGESLLTAKFTAPSTTPKDFLKYRAFCFRGAAAPTSDAGADGGNADAASDAGADAGKKAVSKCPDGHPFHPGAFPTSDLDAYACGESSTVAGEIVLDGVQNEVPYAVAIAAVDKQGNTGILSEVACETPRATNSFWDNYNAAGGQAGGGYCSLGHASAGAGMIALSFFAVAAFVLRRRHVGAFFLGCGLLLCASPSRADEETPSIATIEARFGPYRPQIDKQFEGHAPYDQTFGDGVRMMAGAEVDVTPIHLSKAATIGFGALFGYTYATAKADYADGSGASDEKTSFDLWVLSALTTLRIEALATGTRIPLVPYGKLGLMTGLWNSSDGRGVSRSQSGLVARGRTNGFFYAVGAMLLLDAFDPEAAKTFAAERGVKHSYVFGELTVADLRGFGQSHALQVGDVTWTAGIAFEM